MKMKNMLGESAHGAFLLSILLLLVGGFAQPSQGMITMYGTVTMMVLATGTHSPPLIGATTSPPLGATAAALTTEPTTAGTTTPAKSTTPEPTVPGPDRALLVSDNLDRNGQPKGTSNSDYEIVWHPKYSCPNPNLVSMDDNWCATPVQWTIPFEPFPYAHPSIHNDARSQKYLIFYVRNKETRELLPFDYANRIAKFDRTFYNDKRLKIQMVPRDVKDWGTPENNVKNYIVCNRDFLPSDAFQYELAVKGAKFGYYKSEGLEMYGSIDTNKMYSDGMCKTASTNYTFDGTSNPNYFMSKGLMWGIWWSRTHSFMGVEGERKWRITYTHDLSKPNEFATLDSHPFYNPTRAHLTHNIKIVAVPKSVVANNPFDVTIKSVNVDGNQITKGWPSKNKLRVEIHNSQKFMYDASYYKSAQSPRFYSSENTIGGPDARIDKTKNESIAQKEMVAGQATFRISLEDQTDQTYLNFSVMSRGAQNSLVIDTYGKGKCFEECIFGNWSAYMHLASGFGVDRLNTKKTTKGDVYLLKIHNYKSTVAYGETRGSYKKIHDQEHNTGRIFQKFLVTAQTTSTLRIIADNLGATQSANHRIYGIQVELVDVNGYRVTSGKDSGQIVSMEVVGGGGACSPSKDSFMKLEKGLAHFTGSITAACTNVQIRFHVMTTTGQITSANSKTFTVTNKLRIGEFSSPNGGMEKKWKEAAKSQAGTLGYLQGRDFDIVSISNGGILTQKVMDVFEANNKQLAGVSASIGSLPELNIFNGLASFYDATVVSYDYDNPSAAAAKYKNIYRLKHNVNYNNYIIAKFLKARRWDKLVIIAEHKTVIGAVDSLSLVGELGKKGITAVVLRYPTNVNPTTLNTLIQRVKSSGLNVIFSLIKSSNVNKLVAEAVKNKLAPSNGVQWLGGEDFEYGFPHKDEGACAGLNCAHNFVGTSMFLVDYPFESKDVETMWKASKTKTALSPTSDPTHDFKNYARAHDSVLVLASAMDVIIRQDRTISADTMTAVILGKAMSTPIAGSFLTGTTAPGPVGGMPTQAPIGAQTYPPLLGAQTYPPLLGATTSAPTYPPLLGAVTSAPLTYPPLLGAVTSAPLTYPPLLGAVTSAPLTYPPLLGATTNPPPLGRKRRASAPLRKRRSATSSLFSLGLSGTIKFASNGDRLGAELVLKQIQETGLKTVKFLVLSENSVTVSQLDGKNAKLIEKPAANAVVKYANMADTASNQVEINSITGVVQLNRDEPSYTSSKMIYENVPSAEEHCSGGCGRNAIYMLQSNGAVTDQRVWDDGVCKKGHCMCRIDPSTNKPGFSGANCQEIECGSCLFGKCTDAGVCTCELGYYHKTKPVVELQLGVNDTYVNVTVQEVVREDCATPQCSGEHSIEKLGCNTDQGQCMKPDQCLCYDGFFGRDCNGKCPKCSHGTCSDGNFGNGNCICDSGWLGETCNISLAGIIVGIIIGVCLVAYALLQAVRAFIRYEKLRTALLSMDWKVDWNDIRMRQKKNRSSIKSIVSMVSMKSMATSRMTGKSAKSGMSFKSGKERVICQNQGNWNGKEIVIKTLDKESVELTDAIRKEIRQMKDINHMNLCAFIGAVIESPNVAVLNEICGKGSLEDVLLNEKVELDWGFKFSILKDIVRGMTYLHTTEIGSHGRLKSSNCLVDNRWCVKIADYGMKQFKANQHGVRIFNPGKRIGVELPTEEELVECDYYGLLWTAPEIIATGVAHPNHVQYGTKEGDVFGYGVIMSEVCTCNHPYNELEHLGPEEIVPILGGLIPMANDISTVRYTMSSGAVVEALRPQVPKDMYPKENSEDFKKLMHSCCEEEPSKRPAFRDMMKMLNQISPHRGELMDNLIDLMTHYTQNLEMLISERTSDLNAEKDASDALLQKMLPPLIAIELKMGRNPPPEYFNNVTIQFSDVVGFGKICNESSPIQVVNLLNHLYDLMDDVIDTFDCYKVETIADSYVVASGIPDRNENRHADHIATLALTLLHSVNDVGYKHLPNSQVQLRIGINSGPIVGGVVGLRMPRYCLFGDTMNTASRMESGGYALKIHISQSTYKLLEGIGGFQVINRGEREIKGKGTMFTYWLVGKDGLDITLPTEDKAASLSLHHFK